MKTIRDLLEAHVKIKADGKLAKQIRNFKIRYISKNSELLGGTLIGYTHFFFTKEDENKILIDILGVNRIDFRGDYKNVEAINASFKVTGDELNLCIAFLLYKFNKSKHLSNKAKHQAMIDVLDIFNLRTLAAMHSNGFKKFLVSRTVATEVYERLSNRYL